MDATSDRVGVVGDFNAANETHQATNRTLVDVYLPFEWVPTVEVIEGDRNNAWRRTPASSSRPRVPT